MSPPLATSAATVCSVAARLRGIGSVAGSLAAKPSADGKSSHGSPSNAIVPCSAAIRPRMVRAPLTEICWPTTARIAISNPSTAPGERSPACLRTSRVELRVGAEQVVDGYRVGVEVEQAP